MDGHKISGVITDGDLRRMLLKTDNIGGILAKDIMSKNKNSRKRCTCKKRLPS
jgi:arabinose-5-phosphate isomerase